MKSRASLGNSCILNCMVQCINLRGLKLPIHMAKEKSRTQSSWSMQQLMAQDSMMITQHREVYKVCNSCSGGSHKLACKRSSMIYRTHGHSC